MGNTGQELARRWLVAKRTESDLIEQLLKNRGITDRERFFSPDFERDSHDPYLLPNMDQAISRIVAAINNQELIGVFGDYDADGIPGTALLAKVFKANGAETLPYIPDREKEGYGLNIEAIDYLADKGVRLLITVDLGITNKDQVQYAASRGIDVIVTDHHEIDPERIPKAAEAIVHPRLPGSKYPFGELAGGGVAWKLTQALATKTGQPSLPQLKWWFELPAISTVCDVMSLLDENRMIVHYGLKVLAQTRNVGLQALYKTAGITPDLINAGTVGFQIGPRINAPGRIDHASLALELLLTADLVKAQELAAKIEERNRERQEMLEKMINEAVAKVQKDKLDSAPAIVLTGDNWSAGVIGLAAARIVERFHRPTVMLGKYGDVFKGSGRSLRPFNLLDGILSQKELLESYGGHSMAAGLSVKSENLDKFRQGFVEFASKILSSDDLIPTDQADAVIDPTDISDEVVTKILRFAPFGPDNPKPRFVVGPLTVADIRTVGSDNSHLKLRFTERSLDGIGFRLGQRHKNIKLGDQLAVLGNLEFNTWNGVDRIQIKIDDCKSFSQWENEYRVSEKS